MNTQVERGKVFVKLLNQFSHSPEIAEQCLDVPDVLSHMIELCARLARLKKVTIIAESFADAEIYGDLFNLQHILFRCIEIALLASEKDTALHASLASVPEGFTFSLSNEHSGIVSRDAQNKLATAKEISGRLGGRLDVVMENAPLQLALFLPSQLLPLVR